VTDVNQNMKLMRCGNCGEELVRVFRREDEKNPAPMLAVECSKCRSITEITIRNEPVLQFNWGQGAEGILSVF
jgi:phage FluMu protein Com